MTDSDISGLWIDGPAYSTIFRALKKERATHEGAESRRFVRPQSDRDVFKMKAYLGKSSERSISSLCKPVRPFPALIAAKCMSHFSHPSAQIRPESGRALLAGNTLLLTRIA